jgi:hypothetical protein
MSQQVRDLLDEAVREVPRRPGDLDAVRSRARRRQQRQRVVVAGMAAVLVLVGALVVVPALTDRAPPVIDPPDDGEVTEVSMDELEAAVSSAIAALRRAPGLEGVQQAFIGDHLAAAVWFRSRADGEVVVVQSVDVDVHDSGWWLVDDEPPAAGRRFTTTAWIVVDDVLYEATADNGQPDQPWAISDRQPPVRLALGLALLDVGTDMVGTPGEGWEATRHDLGAGQELWMVTGPHQDGRFEQRWEITDGKLTAWEFELVDVSRQPLQTGSDVLTSGSIEYRALADPDSIAAPQPGDDLNLDGFDLPAGFPTGPN